MSRWFLLAAILIAVSSTQAQAQKPSRGFTFSTDACSKNEQWNFSSAIPSYFRARYRAYLAGEIPNVVGMSEGHSLQKGGRSSEAQLFGAFWKYRSLYQAGAYHLAANGLNWVASRSGDRNLAGIQTAALECLNYIHAKYTRIRPRLEVAGHLPVLNSHFDKTGWYGRNQNILWESALNIFQAQVAEKRPEAEVRPILEVLKNAGPYYFLSQGIWLARNEDFKEASQFLEKFVSSNPMPPHLKRYLNAAHVLLSRSYYKTEQYKKASAAFGKVEKSSNEIVRVLAEKAWVDLMTNNYPEAVGTALNLQSGDLRNTFAPESFMLLAMAYNELCQFPAALRAIRYFHHNYKSVYEWLKTWYVRRKKDPINFYQEVVTYLSKEKSRIPNKVLSEWIRSPIFISHQEELNMILDERKALLQLMREQREENKKIANLVKDLRKEVQGELKDNKGKLPASARDLHREYKIALRTLNAMDSTRLWLGTMVKNFARRLSRLEGVLRARVNSDLKARSVRMLGKLKELGETAYLIQIEIYNGASEDIVWRNAHPGYEEFAKEVKKQSDKKDIDQVWNWGPAPSLQDGSREIWADELGTLKASLNDNCKNKEKYMDVKVLDTPRLKKETGGLEVKGKSE